MTEELPIVARLEATGINRFAEAAAKTDTSGYDPADTLEFQAAALIREQHAALQVVKEAIVNVLAALEQPKLTRGAEIHCQAALESIRAALRAAEQEPS